MRNILSLLLALAILLSTGLFACFYINISGNSKFERVDEDAKASPGEQTETPSPPSQP